MDMRGFKSSVITSMCFHRFINEFCGEMLHNFKYKIKRIQHAWSWCMGMTQRDVMGREVGGGFMFGNACKN